MKVGPEGLRQVAAEMVRSAVSRLGDYPEMSGAEYRLRDVVSTCTGEVLELRYSEEGGDDPPGSDVSSVFMWHLRNVVAEWLYFNTQMWLVQRVCNGGPWPVQALDRDRVRELGRIGIGSSVNEGAMFSCEDGSEFLCGRIMGLPIGEFRPISHPGEEFNTAVPGIDSFLPLREGPEEE